MSLPIRTPQNENEDIPEAMLSPWHFFRSILAPLQNRDFCLLMGGQTISTIGDMFYTVAFPWFMLATGQGAQTLSFALTFYGIPRVACILLGGLLSDRLHPRWVMLMADVARALLIAILAVLILTGHPALWQICMIAVPLGAFTGIFLPASFAIIPHLLSDQKLQAGNALNFSGAQLATSIGPAIAGMMINRLQVSAAFIGDAISFVVSTITLLGMRKGRFFSTTSLSETIVSHDLANTSTSLEEKPAEAILTFSQLLSTTRLIQVALVIICALNLSVGGLMEVSLPALARGIFRTDAAGFGLMLSAFGLGSLLGSISAGGLGRLKYRCATALLLAFVQSICFSIIPFADQVAGTAFILLVAGIANGLTNVLFFTLVQQHVPRHLLGRVLGAFMLASLGLYPLSVILAGLVVAQFGPIAMFPLSIIPVLPGIIFGLSQQELWNI